jgi:hypothetical protein
VRSRPRDASDLGGDFLYDHPQWEAENEGPGQVVAELGADLAVRSYSARVVVRGTGDEPGPQRPSNCASSA